MKNVLLIVPIAVLLCFHFGCRQGKRSMRNPRRYGAGGEANRHFVKAWAEATNASDVERIMSLVTEDCVMIPPNAPPLIGKKRFEKISKKSFDQFIWKGDEEVVDFRVSGDFAFSRGTWAYNITPKAGGESKKIGGKMIHIYHKQPDGSWKLFWNAWSDESLASPSPSEKK